MINLNLNFTTSKLFAYIALALSCAVAIVVKDGSVFINGLFAAAAVIGTKTVTSDWILRKQTEANNVKKPAKTIQTEP